MASVLVQKKESLFGLKFGKIGPKKRKKKRLAGDSIVRVETY